jgi:beta-glucosidase
MGALRSATAGVLILLAAGLVACRTSSLSDHALPLYRDGTQSLDARVDDLLGRMSVAEEIGQMTQADPANLTKVSDIARLGLGSLVSGGDDSPSPNTPTAWADAFDSYQRVALSTPLAIPLLSGVDSVHGFSHAMGTTIFPHNIGLGATRDPALVRAVGRVTAAEMSAAGLRWDFAPCLAVTRNERWGRGYESFGESPDLVSDMAIMVSGLQGADLARRDSVLATAKHFIGDGGTTGGRDQGDTAADEAILRALYLPPYRAALAAGVQSVMVSFSSVNGQKMHANAHLIQDILKGEMHFNGIVVSDWNGIEQLPGSFADQVRDGVNAGIDVFMCPSRYEQFVTTLLAQVENGNVPRARIDDAARRILRVKLEMGLFEHPYADRSRLSQIGSAENRLIARRAVSESVVVLKNEGSLLPLARSTKRILVAGKNADDLGNQLGGWSLTWQGLTGRHTDGTTILEGIRQVVARGSEVVYDRNGSKADSTFDVAIAVIGETPYAEYKGDRTDGLGLDADDLEVLARLHATGVPLVVVLVSGRPLIVTSQLPDWQAFVAAWLPGTEGAGVADILFGQAKPTGTLPVSWPRSVDQIPINLGDADYAPLFPFGFGLRFP